MRTLNLTQHPATAEQVAAGVFEPENKARVKELLTFETFPVDGEIRERISNLLEICKEAFPEEWSEREFRKIRAGQVMVGGASYLLVPLVQALKAWGLTPVSSFTKRIVKEEKLGSGEVRKTSHFRHEGFVPL